MIFKCKNCGGNVVYDPDRKGMFCPFCDSQDSDERNDYKETDLRICPNCGGEVPVEEHTAATKCPYCENYLIFDSRVEGQYEPQMIIPFQLGKESCKKSVREKFGKFLFAPADFLSEAHLNSMEGIYVPYWLFDYDVNYDFKGEGVKIRVWRTGEIENTETSIYEVDRNMDSPFRKIPVDASVQMSDDVMDLMEPFNYDQMVEFKPQYLSGFYAEKYNMTSDLVENRAKQRMKEDATAMMKESYAGYNNIRPLRNDIQVKDAKANYGYIPLWRYKYSYKEKEYPFYVNGQTGKIIGTPPISKAKGRTYAFTLMACWVLLMVLLNGIFRFL